MRKACQFKVLSWMVGHYIIKLDEYKNSNLAQTANAAGTNNLQECHHKPVECNTHKHHFT